jgi:hypothetical protein
MTNRLHLGAAALRLLNFINQVRLYHWTTQNYARHKASGDLVDTLQAKTDLLIETWSGRAGTRLQLPRSSPVALTLANVDDEEIVRVLQHFIEWVNTWLSAKLADATDLLTIRDDILIAVNQTLYLFTFR